MEKKYEEGLNASSIERGYGGHNMWFIYLNREEGEELYGKGLEIVIHLCTLDLVSFCTALLPSTDKLR